MFCNTCMTHVADNILYSYFVFGAATKKTNKQTNNETKKQTNQETKKQQHISLQLLVQGQQLTAKSFSKLAVPGTLAVVVVVGSNDPPEKPQRWQNTSTSQRILLVT